MPPEANDLANRVSQEASKPHQSRSDCQPPQGKDPEIDRQLGSRVVDSKLSPCTVSSPASQSLTIGKDNNSISVVKANACDTRPENCSEKPRPKSPCAGTSTSVVIAPSPSVKQISTDKNLSLRSPSGSPEQIVTIRPQFGGRLIPELSTRNQKLKNAAASLPTPGTVKAIITVPGSGLISSQLRISHPVTASAATNSSQHKIAEVTKHGTMPLVSATTASGTFDSTTSVVTAASLPTANTSTMRHGNGACDATKAAAPGSGLFSPNDSQSKNTTAQPKLAQEIPTSLSNLPPGITEQIICHVLLARFNA